MAIQNLKPVDLQDSPTTQIENIADNFETLEDLLPGDVIDETGDFGKTPNQQTFTIAYTQLTESGNGNSQAITLFDLPSGFSISSVKLYHTVAFSGGGATAVDVEVGVSGDADKYSPSFDVFQSVGDNVLQVSNPSEKEAASDETIIATFTPDASNNLNDLTAGSLHIEITII